MSATKALIERLAEEGAATRGHNAWRFAMPPLAAIALCALGSAVLLDGAFASVAERGAGPTIFKWVFSLTLMTVSVMALWLLGRPGVRTSYLAAAMAAPFVVVAVLLALDLWLNSPPFPGVTWRTCLAAMAVMSPLGFAGAIMAVRRLAPTRLRRAGLAAGLFGGSAAMTAYAPFCPELGMLYMAVFYCLPILAMAAIGWLAGPRLLRW